jgi:hypothetical protein
VNLWVWAVESPRYCGLQREGSLLTSPGALSMHPPRQAALKLGQPFFKRLDGVGDCVGDRNQDIRAVVRFRAIAKGGFEIGQR